MYMYSLLGALCLAVGLWARWKFSKLLNQPSPRVEPPPFEPIEPTIPITVGNVARFRGRLRTHKPHPMIFTRAEYARLERLRLLVESKQLTEF